MDTTAPLCEATIPPQADQQDRTQDVPQDLMHDAPHDTPQDAPSTRRNTRAIPIWAPLRNRAQERLERVALDIGGSLVKVVYYTKRRCDGSSADNDTTSGKVRAPSTGPAGSDPSGRLNFARFETDNLQACVDFLKSFRPKPVVIKATGGGAHRFAQDHQHQLGASVEKEDEMECLTAGLDFLIREVPNEVFSYRELQPSGDDSDAASPPNMETHAESMVFEEIVTDTSAIYPYLLVNIGSGVSILKVTADGEFERVSGTSCGGGTLWGILRLLTPAKSFDEMLKLSEVGDNRNVDMLVGDIYGKDYARVGLKASTIASSCGKIHRQDTAFQPADLAKSLLYMISNTIAQIAYLNAKLYGVRRIYFAGTYIRGHPLTMSTLSYAIRFWSKGDMCALFLRHEGYLGAMGAFLKGMAVDDDDGSFAESFTRVQLDDDPASVQIPALGELTRLPTRLLAFPLLLDVVTYDPDIVDLGANAALREYWLDQFDRNLNRILLWATGSATALSPAPTPTATPEPQVDRRSPQGNAPSADHSAASAERSISTNERDILDKITEFKTVFRAHLDTLRRDPSHYGALSLRTILSLREQCLHDLDLPDIFARPKSMENDAALEALPQLLEKLDSIEDERVLIDELVHGILAGNMFDWGSDAILRMVVEEGGDTATSSTPGLDFKKARTLLRRPEHLNYTDRLTERLVEPSGSAPYHKAIIFVDNSGADCILGILPFARYLLRRGTRVVLAANTYPALNDITASELADCLDRVSDDVLSSAWHTRRLRVVGTGSASPCLDLRRVSVECVQAAEDADLVVVEGMGRAIHTNFRARFRVDVLKVAVVKNTQVGRLVGCGLYDGLCVFEEQGRAQ